MLTAIIKSMRPRQWTKNVFIFAGLIFDRQLTNPIALLHTFAGFGLFCILSGCIYLINDVFDVEADRVHPKKCKRPIAAGTLPIPVAIVASVVLLIGTFSASFFLSFNFFIVVIAYFIMNLAYSRWLKHIPILDVLIVALGFVFRVFAGVSVIQVERFSPWLYVCMYMLALFMLFGKRRAELTLLANNANSHRKVLDGYTLPFLDQIIMIVSSVTLVGYSLYTFSAPNVPENHTMMLTIPFVLFALFRYLYLVQVKQEGGAPEDLVMSDRPFLLSVLLWGISVLVIFYLF